jgi:hypothetical protein
VVELKPASGAAAVRPPLTAPRSLTEALNRNKYLIWADYKHGKSSFACSVVRWWQEQGWPPETCRMAILDLDDGLAPLVEKGAIPDEYMPCISYYLCRNFAEVEDATKREIEALRSHADKHGVDRAWLVIDNMEAAWEWARDHYAIMTYGKIESEVAADKRRARIESGEANKPAPTFSPQNDYSIINPIHNNWADSMKFSGVSLMWLTPQKATKKDFFDKDEVPELGPAGQKGNPGRVDHIIRLWRKDAPSSTNKYEYYADILASRTAKQLVTRIPNPTFSLIRSLIKGQRPGVKPSSPAQPAAPPAEQKVTA